MIFDDQEDRPARDPADRMRSDLASAHAEALRVHDSPVRSDRVYASLEMIARRLDAMDGEDERVSRASTAVAAAMRTLRLDADGRDAAKHLQTAMRQFEARERRPSPFLDDL